MFIDILGFLVFYTVFSFDFLKRLEILVISNIWVTLGNLLKDFCDFNP